MIKHGQSTMNSYPTQFISHHVLSDGTQITIRPVRGDDEKMIKEYVSNLSSKSKHFNFMENFKEIPIKMLRNLIDIDYKKTMTLIVTYQLNGKEIPIGMVHYYAESDDKSAEFDMIVEDEWQTKNIGTRLT